MTLSSEQQHILDVAAATSDNLLISACAGGAKTTTMCAIAAARGNRGDQVVALAFNTDAADALSRRMPYYVTSSTFHRWCNNALRAHFDYAPKIDGRKMANKLKELCPKWSERVEIEDDVLTLVSLSKAHALVAGEHSVRDLADENGFSEDTLAYANRLLRYAAETHSTIDFDDMLWLPWLLAIKFPPVALILLDEAQDTNSCQRQLLSGMCSNGARLIAVGDTHQSIYAFRGADHNAMPALREAFNMTELQLSVSYRCSKAVVEEARKYL